MAVTERRDRFLKRTARLLIDVSFRPYDTTDEDAEPYYSTDELVGVVMGWIEGALNDRDDVPTVKLVTSRIDRRMVDEDGKVKFYNENGHPVWKEPKR